MTDSHTDPFGAWRPDVPLHDFEVEVLAALRDQRPALAARLEVEQRGEQLALARPLPSGSAQQISTELIEFGVAQGDDGAAALGSFGLAVRLLLLSKQRRQRRGSVQRSLTRARQDDLAENLLTDAACYLALALLECGSFADAAALFGWRLQIVESALGADSEPAMEASLWLARALFASGELREARELQQRVYEASERLLGPEHPDTLTTAGSLASTLGALG